MNQRTRENQTVLLDQHGMSLIEILIVITLMAVVGTIAATQVTARLQEGYVSTARTQIGVLKGQMEEYARYCNRYPTTEQGLEALVSKPTVAPECPNYPASAFLKDGKVPKDPWDRPYEYESPDGGKSFVITSLGKDGVQGGEEKTPDADIKSTD